MKNLLSKIFITLLVLILYSNLFSSQLHISINDPIYKYLDRLSTQGVLPSYMNATLPLTRDYIADMLIILDKSRDNLSVVDQKLLDEYLADYTYEFKEKSYFQLEVGENTYHPFMSWKTVHKGFKNLVDYIPNQEEHHLSVYQKNDNLIWLDIGGIARNKHQNSHL